MTHEPTPLSDELRAVEEALRGRGADGPPAALRTRTLASIDTVRETRRRPSPLWTFGKLAAAIVFVANVAWSAWMASDTTLAPPLVAGSAEPAAELRAEADVAATGSGAQKAAVRRLALRALARVVEHPTPPPVRSGVAALRASLGLGADELAGGAPFSG